MLGRQQRRILAVLALVVGGQNHAVAGPQAAGGGLCLLGFSAHAGPRTFAWWAQSSFTPFSARFSSASNCWRLHGPYSAVPCPSTTTPAAASPQLASAAAVDSSASSRSSPSWPPWMPQDTAATRSVNGSALMEPLACRPAQRRA